MAGRGTDIALHPAVARRGGLHVILCQANPSMRIDLQFLGRCARRGEAGLRGLYVLDCRLPRRGAELRPTWLASLLDHCDSACNSVASAPRGARCGGAIRRWREPILGVQTR